MQLRVENMRRQKEQDQLAESCLWFLQPRLLLSELQNWFMVVIGTAGYCSNLIRLVKLNIFKSSLEMGKSDRDKFTFTFSYWTTLTTLFMKRFCNAIWTPTISLLLLTVSTGIYIIYTYNHTANEKQKRWMKGFMCSLCKSRLSRNFNTFACPN